MKKNGIIILVFLLLCWLPSTALTAEVTYYHTDAHGTPMAMTDSTGKVVWKGDYYPFGEEYSIEETPEKNKRHFTGKEKDEESGLHYFGARYMDEVSGRFISPDPVTPVDPQTSATNTALLGNPLRLNRYVYGLNNPYRYIDPDGEYAIPMYLTVATVLGVGATFYMQTHPEVATKIANGIRNWYANENTNSNDSPVPDATPGRKTKGKTTQWEKKGGMDAANEDFDNLNPENVKKIPNGGRVGDLTKGGGRVIVRPNSSDGRPTLETQQGKRKHKVRYDD